MGKTANAINPRKGKLEFVVSSALASAIAGLTTAETIDLTSIFKGATGGDLSRDLNKEYVAGDDEPLIDYGTRLVFSPYVFSFVFTNGAEQLGTDNLDFWSIMKEILEYTGGDASPQFIYSPAGGATGDMEYTTDPTDTRLTNLSAPVGGVSDQNKVQCTLTVDTPSVTESSAA